MGMSESESECVQPVYAGEYGVACVCKKMKKWKNENRDSLARKSYFNQLCGGYQA